MQAIALRVVRRRCWYTLHMEMSEQRAGSPGLLSRIQRILGKKARHSDEPLSEPQTEPDGLSGPSGLPAAPLRVEKRGL